MSMDTLSTRLFRVGVRADDIVCRTNRRGTGWNGYVVQDDRIPVCSGSLFECLSVKKSLRKLEVTS